MSGFAGADFVLNLCTLSDRRSKVIMAAADGRKQLLHLVFGGELARLSDTEFRNLDDLDIVGVYPDYKSAEAAWKAKAQSTVDNAHMRYFIVHLHRLLDPEHDKTGTGRS